VRQGLALFQGLGVLEPFPRKVISRKGAQESSGDSSGVGAESGRGLNVKESPKTFESNFRSDNFHVELLCSLASAAMSSLITFESASIKQALKFVLAGHPGQEERDNDGLFNWSLES